MGEQLCSENVLVSVCEFEQLHLLYCLFPWKVSQLLLTLCLFTQKYMRGMCKEDTTYANFPLLLYSTIWI